MPVGAPLVTVVVPAHGAGQTIGATVASLLWQTYPALEVIVVDDGSEDATAAVVVAVQDTRVRLIRQEHAGPAAARNRGIAEAHGELVAFVDADDVLFPGYLSRCVDVWRPSGGIVTSNAYWMFRGGIDPAMTRHRGPLPRPRDQRLTLLHHNWVSIMSVFPRRLVDEVGGFDESLKRAEDWEFWLRAVYAGWTVHHQPRPMALFNRSAESRTSSRDLVHASETQILERMSARHDLTEQERRYLRTRLSSPGPAVLVERAAAGVRAGHYRMASRQLRQAAQLVPSQRELVFKSRLLRVAPGIVGPFLRRRARRRDSQLGDEQTAG